MDAALADMDAHKKHTEHGVRTRMSRQARSSGPQPCSYHKCDKGNTSTKNSCSSCYAPIHSNPSPLCFLCAQPYNVLKVLVSFSNMWHPWGAWSRLHVLLVRYDLRRRPLRGLQPTNAYHPQQHCGDSSFRPVLHKLRTLSVGFPRRSILPHPHPPPAASHPFFQFHVWNAVHHPHRPRPTVRHRETT